MDLRFALPDWFLELKRAELTNMSSFGIRAKLLLSFAALLSVMVAAGLYELGHNDFLARQTTRIYDESLAVTRAALQTQSGILAMHRSMKDVVLAVDEHELNEALAQVEELESVVYQHLESARKSAKGEKATAMVDQTTLLFDQWRPIRSEVLSLVRSGKRSEAVAITKGKGARHVEVLLDQAQKLWAYADNQAKVRVAETRVSVDIDSAMMTAIFALALFMSVVLAFSVSHHIGGRLKQINDASMKISLGDFDQTLDVHGADEIAQLADTFNLMAFSLAKLHGSLNMEIAVSKEEKEGRIRLEKAIEQTGEVVIITDVEGNIQYVNPAFERNTGYTKQEAIGKNPRILKSGAHDDAFYREMWDSLLSHGQWAGVITNKRKDGTLYDDQATISAVKNEKGEIVNYVAVKRDITEHKTILEELRESQAVLASAQRIAHLGNWDWDIRTGEMKWSTEIYNIFGFPEGETGQTYEAFISMTHPDDRETMDTTLRMSIQDHSPFTMQRRIIHSDGQERIILERGEPLYDSGDQPVRVIGTIQDITDRVNDQKDLLRLQEKEKELQRERDELEKALFEQKSLSGWEQSSVTASLAGVGPLRERFPEIFAKFKSEYEALLDEYLEALGFNRTPPRHKINALSENIGAYGGGPRDLIDLHIRSVSDKSRDVHPKRARAYTVEGRLLALEAMGNLVDCYRRGGIQMERFRKEK
ncbi:MAG: PAS domain S-box protein [Nitrospinota bacterium]|nr:PAS domain S-box protein [Nitrospinota bacterium]